MMGWRIFSLRFLLIVALLRLVIKTGFQGQDGVPSDYREFIGISHDGVQFDFVISTVQINKNFRFISVLNQHHNKYSRKIHEACHTLATPHSFNRAITRDGQ